jgi:hypothetical protein
MPASSTTPMSGIWRRPDMAAVAGPVSPEPVIATAPSETIFWYSCDATVAEALSLAVVRLNLRPLTPPAALMSETASLAPLTMATPVDP